MQKLGQSDPHCTYNNLAYQVCSNPECTYHPFICQDNCQCKIHHRQCEKFDWQHIKDKLICSKVKKNPTFQSFTNNVESLYQNIIKQVTKAYEDFIEWKNNFGFTAKESQFIKFIEDRRYNQITGSDIAAIRKQIRIPSKMIMKTQRQIKEKVLMINSYAQSMLLQFSELYSKNKVVKVNTQKSNIENIDENENNIEQINQNKINLVHRLLGLNEKGSRFLMMLNENAIETKLQKLIEKINSNEGTIMNAMGLKIEELRQNIKDQKKQITQCRNEIKKEISQSKNEIKTGICQFRKENKTQNDDIKKEVTQFRKENKTQNDDIKKEVTQFRKENKTQNDDIKKEVTQFRKENKTQNDDIKKEVTQFKKENKTQNDDIKKEVTQFKKENKTQNDDIKKEVTQFKKENKTQNDDIKKEVTQFKKENKTQNDDIKKEVTQFKKENKTQNDDIKKEVTQFKKENKTQNDDIKKEVTQFKKENKTQNDDIKKEVTQFRKENKQVNSIKNNVQILKQKIFIESKINIKKFKIISNIEQTLPIKNKQLLLFSPQTLKQSLKIQSSKSLTKIEQKFLSILQNHIQKKLSIDDLNKQSIIAQKQAELIKQEYDLMSKNFEMMKIHAISFLFQKKITKLNLIYRASQNNFQVSNFHQKCDGKQHTITILKTQFGNVIGGYTPLPWDKNKGGIFGNYQTDNSMQSFIFSLTNKHKLTMKQGQQNNAIFHSSNIGPRFGGGADIKIYDKANQNNSSYGRPGNTYNNNNEYVDGNQQSYKKWSGQSSGNSFKILQWQVYSIVFA